MNWWRSVERKIEPFAIAGIVRYVVALNALTFVLLLVAPGYAAALALIPERVLSGEVWRLFTWIFIPPTTSPIFIFFALMLLWIYGEHLEQAWGSLRMNLFYLTGMLGCTVAAFFTGGGLAYNVLLNFSVFFAFATVNPNFQLLLLFILPVKVKWLAWIAFALLALQALVGPWSLRAAFAVAFLNYALFFGPTLLRNAIERSETQARRRRFEAQTQRESTLHTCHECGRTEVSHPDLEFRVSRDGNEYCVDHLPARPS